MYSPAPHGTARLASLSRSHQGAFTWNGPIPDVQPTLTPPQPPKPPPPCSPAQVVLVPSLSVPRPGLHKDWDSVVHTPVPQLLASWLHRRGAKEATDDVKLCTCRGRWAGNKGAGPLEEPRLRAGTAHTIICLETWGTRNNDARTTEVQRHFRQLGPASNLYAGPSLRFSGRHRNKEAPWGRR